jgi:hypothetical protein
VRRADAAGAAVIGGALIGPDANPVTSALSVQQDRERLTNPARRARAAARLAQTGAQW